MNACFLHPRKDTLTTPAAFAHIECGCDDELDWLLADVALEAELGPVPEPEPMLPNEAWRLGSPDSSLVMHRWACTDGRYSWGLSGPCPICGVEHDHHAFEVTVESDPDVVQPILFDRSYVLCPTWLAS
jgi:hypothetical protein